MSATEARNRLLTMAAAMVRGTGVCERPHRNGEAHPHVHFDDAYIGRGRELSNIARSFAALPDDGRVPAELLGDDPDDPEDVAWLASHSVPVALPDDGREGEP